MLPFPPWLIGLTEPNFVTHKKCCRLSRLGAVWGEEGEVEEQEYTNQQTCRFKWH
jgi:hypothetical protein